MLPVYIVTLFLSGGLLGLFVRRLAAQFGYIPDFQSGLMVVLACAMVYICAQTLFMGLLRLLKPTRDSAPLIAEVISHAAVVFLLPYLAHLQAPWPHPKLVELEPLIYLGAFGGMHIFFKFVTLYGMTQSRPAGRFAALGWAAAAVAAALVVLWSTERWHHAIQTSRFVEAPAVGVYRSGEMYATGRQLSEGAVIEVNAQEAAGDLVTNWAWPGEDADAPDSITVTLTAQNGFQAGVVREVKLSSDGWALLRIPREELPGESASWSLFWTINREPEWVTRTGIRPTLLSGRKALMTGPTFADPKRDAALTRMVVLCVDGLGAANSGYYGYERAATPFLDQFARTGVAFENAYTPMPSGPATAVSILSGEDALAHGYYPGGVESLPAGLSLLPALLQRQGYVTAAFTEGDFGAATELRHGGGLERGFAFFNDAYPVRELPEGEGPRPARGIHGGSAMTLNKALDWAGRHKDEPIFLFVRLRELEEVVLHRRYARTFIPEWQRNPPPIDVYDSALTDVDKQIEAFLTALSEMPEMENTAVVVAGAYGYDFSEPGRGAWRKGGPASIRFEEDCLRVPLIIHAPGQVARKRESLVSLSDLAPTLAMIAGLPEKTFAGQSILEYAPRQQVMSASWNPLQLSLRTERWRFSVEAGQTALDALSTQNVRVTSFIDVNELRAKTPQKDYLKFNPVFAQEYAEALVRYGQEQGLRRAALAQEAGQE
ncbi:MAG: sulfatase-like hydrolase/transferase [Candidatus Hydrogenedentes bacterium]|nr:sulfatase-like hydrolase/transferase [Candidatus Hydrogenedentota bacterium]